MSQNNQTRWYKRKKVLIPLGTFMALIIFSLVVMIANYNFPSFFRLFPQSDGQVIVEYIDIDEAHYLDSSATQTTPPTWRKGLMLANTLVVLGDDMFANWLPNDTMWPTIFLDNPQNFQLGELEMMRYTTRVLRDKLTRLRTTDKIDPDCDEAFTLLSNDAFKWMWPSAESRFEKATDKLKSYRDRLAQGKADFYPRADNLSELLDQYVSLMGGINTRLANAPQSQRYKISQESAGEVDVTRAEKKVDTNVPWNIIDDNFYYAQGAAYVLRQVMVAIKSDFSEILEVKKASTQVDSILEVLDQAQFEPIMVLNGDVGSITANHSMELHSLLENARQKIRNLNDMLRQ